jgi:hypothetical protein
LVASFRDRFLTPPVARAITSPSAILLGGVGISAGILVGAPVVGVALGVGAVAARVLAAVPRQPRRPGINPRELDDPWRTLMEEILDAGRRFDAAVTGLREGPLRDRLRHLRSRLDAAVDEAWRIATAGQALTAARRQIDTTRIVAELQAAEGGPRTPRTDQTISAIRAQLGAAERLDRTIADTHDRLRLLDARIDETITRTVELSVSQTDLQALSGLGDEIDSIVDDMEALRQAVEETGTGPATGFKQRGEEP